MKKIIFTILVVLITFLIYFFNRSEKIYYVSLGDYLSYGINNFKNVNNSYSNNIKEYHKQNLDKYVNYSSYDDYRVMDLINDINYNKTVIYEDKEYKLQNLLIKANLITISIGMNDLIYKSNYDTDLYEYTDDLLKDIESLLILIRKYNKDEIYFLSFYNVIGNENLIEYANKRLEIICNKNKIKLVDISLLNNYIIDKLYPTNDGYMYITNKILYFTKQKK
ncbi:MAG: SGNH/GDSL hydrolase family protein [Firmicutes bacterium]|nr:SGNH/GDSL hydrolase family protein [Bacillota bacterium]